MDNALVYGLATLAFGLLALIVKYLFKSKCKEVACCFDMIVFKRSVEIEEKVEEKEEEEEKMQATNRPMV
ncbi:hypothetical protein EBZ38_06810 [bacterium]|nr:hypothetical protein [bacterium]